MGDLGHNTDCIIMRCGLCGHDLPMPVYVGVDGAVYLASGPHDPRHVCFGAISRELAENLNQPMPKKKKPAKSATKRGTR